MSDSKRFSSTNYAGMFLKNPQLMTQQNSYKGNLEILKQNNQSDKLIEPTDAPRKRQAHSVMRNTQYPVTLN